MEKLTKSDEIRAFDEETQKGAYEVARPMGYLFYTLGWLGFIWSVLLLKLMPEPEEGGDVPGFIICGCFIVVGWLLIRFGDGLFPFSKRVFK
jgi:hypothetical protein